MSNSKRQLISTFLWRHLGAILIEPPLSGYASGSVTCARKVIMDFLGGWKEEIRGKVIDVGAGGWLYPRELFGGKCNYISVDKNPGRNIDVIVDVHHLTEKFGRDSCDFVICTDVLEHLENPHLAVGEFFNVLKPEGRLLLTVPFNYKLHYNPDHVEVRDYWRISADGLSSLLKNFSNTVITPFGHKHFPYCYTVVARKP